MQELSKQDQKYLKSLKRRNHYYLIAALILVACLAILFLGTSYYELKINQRASDYLSGFLLAIAAVLFIYVIRNRKLIKDPKLIKRERIKNSDERNVEIMKKSLQFTSYFMMITLVLTSVIGSFLSEAIMQMASLLIALFFISYLLCYLYFKKRL
ncbi:hypothetical protein [Enterococcus hermanniensis]|uniref:DUF2178 domain-containing protein n=1 Tax=Enterococcus hermanniensis TaxID=249189 RepID=A0A1L8TJN5_9ENTE|nr:hypothetical protein [Enterococcus hermanniensis]OJG44322.1 hypothetical protein RV04_GL000516 [Enterococcus hermanniensis]